MHITDPLLTAREGAASLQISVPTFWRRVADGTIPPAIKLGGLSRWPQSEIAAVIDKAKARRDQAHLIKSGPDERDIRGSEGGVVMDSSNEQPSSSSNREETDDYSLIILRLNSDWRIIECRDRILWILQRRSGERRGQPRWVSLKYNRNKQALIRNVHALAGEIDPAVREVLDCLPEWMGR